jgi:dihydroorotase
MQLIIKNGRVIDPDNLDGEYDILVEDGKIVSAGSPGDFKDKESDGVTVIDARGLIVSPGLVDMHVHLREPGHEYKETIGSGLKAAAHGGFTAVCSMPNTNPVNDNRQVTEFIIRRAKEENLSRVYPVGSITFGLSGRTLCEYGELKSAGVVAVSDDGRPVENGQVMRRAMEYAKGFDLPVISHCEDMELAADGCMNEGVVSTRLGLPGIPNISESNMVKRDIGLAELTGCRLHFAHISTRESVDAIREAKKNGIKVTAETAPHYFTLTEEAVLGYNTNAKMNPPLRTEQDRQAIRKGLADGTIDCIATDHAPHSVLEKDVEFKLAANGITGLETSLSLGLQLVFEGVLSLAELIKKMSVNPSAILGLTGGIRPGVPADLTIIDIDKDVVVDSGKHFSKSVNTPFNGMKLKGTAVYTIVGGEIIYSSEL